MKQILAILFLFAGLSVASITDTIFVPVHVTDTIYVASPPDTVIIQKKPAFDNRDIDSSETIINDVDLDTVTPAINFYFGIPLTFNGLSAFWGTVFLDFLVEIENTHRGSLLFGCASMIQLWNPQFGHSGWWEGIRSSTALGIGYRQYLATTTQLLNPKKKKVIHKNVPLNSTSLYVQGMAFPTFKFAYENYLGEGDAKKPDLSTGVAGEASTGVVWNSNNLLVNLGVTLGYQYWPEDSRKFLNFGDEDSKFLYNIVTSTTPRSVYVRVITSFGF